jgi:chromate transporter
MSGEEKHNQPQPETLRKRRDEPSDATDVEKAASSSAVSVAEANDNHNDNHNDSDEEVEVIVEATWRELAYHWFVLGWTAFGGPAAHIGMYHRLFVEKLKWCSNVVFTELFMLGQCMPGPTSTQMGFAQGVLKKGLPGGLVSGALFQGPGLLILSALGWSLANTLAKNVEWLNGMVSGLAAAGIALVAGAAVSLNKKINNTRELQVISTTSAVIAFYWPRPWTFPCLILLGGLTSILMSKLFPRLMKTQSQKSMNAGVGHLGLNKVGGAAVLALWIAVLVAVLVAAGQTAYVDQKELHWFAAFYRTGSIIFGGGQVVLPMLYNDVVAADCANQEAICCPKDLTQVADQIGNTSGILLNQTLIDLCSDYSTALYADECKCSWMSASQFYFGLSAAQACPGPLFNFSAYLGAVIAQNAGVFAIAGIALCWVGLFAPGILIIFGILPWVSYASDVCFPHARVC